MHAKYVTYLLSNGNHGIYHVTKRSLRIVNTVIVNIVFYTLKSCSCIAWDEFKCIYVV